MIDRAVGRDEDDGVGPYPFDGPRVGAEIVVGRPDLDFVGSDPQCPRPGVEAELAALEACARGFGHMDGLDKRSERVVARNNSPCRTLSTNTPERKRAW